MARPRTFDEATVLTAARETFWRLGVGNTSISDLEAATGLKRTSLYAAFGNKEALLKRTLSDYQVISRRLMNDCLASTDRPLDGLRRLLRISVEQAIEDPERRGCFINNVASERTANCPSVGGWINENRESVIKEFRAVLKRAKAAGQLAKDRDETKLAHYLFTLYSGLMATVKAGAAPEDLRVALEAGLEILG